MNLHPSVTQAFEEIDAALFTGDSFIDKENREHLVRMLARWKKQAEVCEVMEKEIKQEEDLEKTWRCGVCYWALYDADFCQNPDCKMHSFSVNENRLKLTNDEAATLIALKQSEGQS
jgi:hypothetical protein